jgi:hypothetical protein
VFRGEQRRSSEGRSDQSPVSFDDYTDGTIVCKRQNGNADQKRHAYQREQDLRRQRKKEDAMKETSTPARVQVLQGAEGVAGSIASLIANLVVGFVAGFIGALVADLVADLVAGFVAGLIAAPVADLVAGIVAGLTAGLIADLDAGIIASPS